MPECATCGSEDFELMGGHFYCIICQTQSQTVREEEAPDICELVQSGTGAIRSVTIRKDGQDVEKGEDKGRPWRTAEAFQIILKAQVEALIGLGLSPDLKDTVFKLWVAYLSRTGEAFCGEQDSSQTSKGGGQLKRARDVLPLTSDNPKVGKVRGRPAREKAHETLLKVQRQHTTGLPGDDLVQEMEQPDSDVDDHTLSVAMVMEEDQEEKMGDTEDADYSSMLLADPQQHQKRQRTLAMSRHKCISRMSMPKTVSFLYLGLLYTDTMVTPLDLLRYINERRIPYYNVTSLLPKDMKFYSSDWYSFSDIGTLTVEAVLTLTSRMARYLGIQELPQPSVLSLTCKLIRSLNLPGELHGLMKLLVEEEDPGVFRLCRTTERGRYQRDRPSRYAEVNRNLVDREVVAMAYVMMLLRLVFRLDGYTEDNLAEAGKAINDLQVEGMECFVWSEWTAWLELEVMKKKGQLPPHDIRSVHQVSSVSSTAADLGETLVQRRTDQGLKENRAFREEVLDQMKRPLATLVGKLRTAQAAHIKSNIQDNRHTRELTAQGTMAEDELLSHEGSLSDVGSQKQKQIFWKKSIQYILRPKFFLEKLEKQLCHGNHGYHSRTHDSGNQSIDLFGTDTESLFSTPKKIYSEVHQGTSPARSVLDSPLVHHTSPESIPRSRSKYDSPNKGTSEYGMDTLVAHLYDALAMDKRPALRRLEEGYELLKQSPSYYWLIQACSVIVGCKPEKLHKAVVQVQTQCESSSRLKAMLS